ncbi:hypothetical protein P389DRAFT_42266 [Cystobasidium minutum MCA 4210]|uniref:uncharacterized protein n=1 Tax=Cystobasidium minutum MCA 4210 TaxID=1397322 RepID=UPI0034CEB87C|eukprot:jgi/Rhomi1/42266/CE42265_1226
MTQTVSINDRLPVEVLRKVFDELFYLNEGDLWEPPRTRYKPWMTVCKLWHDILKETLYRSIQIDNVKHLHKFYHAIKQNRRRARYIQSFQIQDEVRRKSNTTNFTRIPFVNLRYLGLTNVLVQKTAPCFAASASTITTLNLKDVTFASDRSLRRFMKSFTSLKSLHVEGFAMDDSTITKILQIVGRNLERFSVNVSYTQDMMAILALMPQIKHLNLYVSRRSSWHRFAVEEMPPHCESFSVETTDLVLLLKVMAALSDPLIMPKLNKFPRIRWSPCNDQYPLPYSLPIQGAKENARRALIERGITWTTRDAFTTLMDGVECNFPCDASSEDMRPPFVLHRRVWEDVLEESLDSVVPTVSQDLTA